MLKLLDDLRTEADLCRNETADDIADLLDRAANEIERQIATSASLVRWKAEIDSRRIALCLPFPDDYDNSPKYAVHTLVEAEKNVHNNLCEQRRTDENQSAK